jgi:hypothetical protein
MPHDLSSQAAEGGGVGRYEHLGETDEWKACQMGNRHGPSPMQQMRAMDLSLLTNVIRMY